MKKLYTRKQIAEAIDFWESKLAALDERRGDEDADAKDEGKNKGEDEDEEEDEEEGGSAAAELKPKEAPPAKPIGKFNIMKRIVRLHNVAVKKGREEVMKQLNKTNAVKDEEAVIFENDCIDDDEQSFDYKAGKVMNITMKVLFDKAHVKGFRKLMAVLLKEEDDKKLDQIQEGFFSTIGAAMKAAGKEAGEKADQSIKAANEELAKTIGVAGLKRYVLSLCGKNLADKVKMSVPGTEEGDGEVRFIYKTAITLV